MVSIVTYTGDGSTTDYTIPFEYLDDAHVVVELTETVTTAWSFLNETTVRMNTAPASGDRLVIKRATPDAPIVDFTDGSTLFEADLDLSAKQSRLLGSEARDRADEALQLVNNNLTDILAVRAIATDVSTVADNDSNVTTVADDLNGTDTIGTVAGSITNVNTVGTNVADVNTVAGSIVSVNTVASNDANVTTVAGISGDVTTAAGISADITAVAADATDIGTVSASIANVDAVGTNITNVNTVAGINTDVTTVAGINTDVSTVATNASAITTASSNIADINNASANAATATTKAAEALASANNAATSATNASTSAATATTKATEAAASAAAAATSAANLSTAETNAAASATAASASQVAAAASAASAATVYDTFDDRYLGSKATEPTVDNDGNALVQGALYFNTTANEMRVYDGGSWIAASSAGGASMLEYLFIATAGQTAFTGSDQNGNTLSYTATNLIVILNGVILEPTVDYTATDGLTITLSSSAVANDELHIIAFKSFTTADMVSATNGGTFGNGVNILGNVGVGTSSPSAGLHVLTDVNPTLKLDRGSANTTNANLYYNGTLTGQLSAANADFQISAAGASTPMSFYTNGSERMRIDNSGNVGIGTSSPTKPLQVRQTAAGSGLSQTDIRLTRDEYGADFSGYIDQGVGHGAIISTVDNGTPTERMRINSNGNVGINTTAPEATLHINDVGTTGPALFIENATSTEGDITWDSSEVLQMGTWNKSTDTFNELMTTHYNGDVNFFRTTNFLIGRDQANSSYDSGERNLYIYAGSSDDQILVSARNVADGSPAFRCMVGGTTRAEIEANGDFLSATNAYGGTSDQTLKENIVASGSQWDDLKAVQVKKFSYIADDLDTANMIGVIAQDLEASGMSGLVSSMDNDDGTTVKTVKYSVLYMKAIKALQEAMERIETLETEMTSVKARLDALETN